MASLNSMPNIGKVLEQALKNVDIKTKEELIAVGSKEAFARIKVKDPTACLSKLSALEGAVRGMRWHDLDNEVKKDLKVFFESF